MSLITEKIDNILKNKNLTRYKLSKMIDCSESALNQMARSEISFSDKIKERIIPILEVSKEEFESWILADKYSEEVLKLAIKVKQESASGNKLILTAKIDEILQSKNISRTRLSKLVKYDQSSINKMITGKGSVSKTVLSRFSNILDISEDEIESWIIADKYSTESLESALREL